MVDDDLTRVEPSESERGQAAALTRYEPPQNAPDDAPAQERAEDDLRIVGSELRTAGGQEGRAAAVGTVIRSRYELVSVLGEGSMGVVYRALDRLHKEMQDRDPYVAIKILGEALRRSPNALIALQREARRAQTLAHENIVNVHSFDRDGPIVYMTMELLDGKTLRTVIAERVSSGLPRGEVVRMILGMAKALAYAHENDIVHCDFKPSNVFLTRKNQIKVLDFGVARAAPAPQTGDGATDAPAVVGMTPAYASPQMLEGQDPAPADDVFALAVVCYELVTGRHPFEGCPADEARLRAARSSPLPGLSRPRRRALLRALSADRESRHATAGAFLKEFEGSRSAKAASQAGIAAAAVLPVVAFFLSQGSEPRPAVPFEELTPEMQAQFNVAVDEGATALGFGDAGLYDALVYFTRAYELHPGNERAVDGLETVADRFLVSLRGTAVDAQSEVFDLLYCHDYLSQYEPVTIVCGDLLGSSQCASIAGRCSADFAN